MNQTEVWRHSRMGESNTPAGVCAPGAVFRTRKKPPPKRHGSSEQISESFTETSPGWWIGEAVVGSIAMYMD